MGGMKRKTLVEYKKCCRNKKKSKTKAVLGVKLEPQEHNLQTYKLIYKLDKITSKPTTYYFEAIFKAKLLKNV